MVYTELTKRAMHLAFEAHAGQVDKGGIPYVLHPVHLAEQMDTEYEVCAALLHDVLEDSIFTVADLRDLRFPEEVITAVKYLTKVPAETYSEYIDGLKDDVIARKVKIADLKHNIDLTRLAQITQKDIDRAEKYKKFLKRLEK